MLAASSLLVAVFALAPPHASAPKQAKVHAQASQAPVITRLAATLGTPVTLTAKERKRLSAVASAVVDGQASTARRSWVAFAKRYVGSHPSATRDDINALLGLVLKQSYLDQHEDLALLAAKVEFFNQQKQAIQAHLTALRDAVAGRADDAKLTLQPLELMDFKAGGVPTTLGRAKTMTVAEWTTVSTHLGAALERAESSERLGHIELRQLLAAYNQAAQLMENVFKTMDDAYSSIIGKI